MAPPPQVCAGMSSPGGASSAYPLHVLVWNNDYRRLDEELQDQVTGCPGPEGAAELFLVAPKRACATVRGLVPLAHCCAREEHPGGTAQERSLGLRDPCTSLPVYLWCGSDGRRRRNMFSCQILNVGFPSVKLCS